MKLTISGVARIGAADIDLNGITVLVGDNNTGKTTIGKVLYAFFDSFAGIEKDILSKRLSKCSDALWEFIDKHNTDFSGDMAPLSDSIVQFLAKAQGAEEKLLADIHSFCDKTFSKEDFAAPLDKLRSIRDLAEHDIGEQIVTNNFRRVFFNDYLPAKPRASKESKIGVVIKGHPIELSLQKEGIHYSGDYSIEHRAYYIDTPDLIEDIAPGSPMFSNSALNSALRGIFMRTQGFSGLMARPRVDLTQAIADNMAHSNDSKSNAIDDIFAKEKIHQVLARIESVIPGEVKRQARGAMFADPEMESSFKLENLSRGICAFALLQTAVRHHVLKERDILIFDEPEIHLHPEWLLDYAEILVIMQEVFDLTILITTHSPFFLQALQLYAKKHHRANILNAYQTFKAEDGNFETSTELSGDAMDKAYEGFIAAVNRMHLLRDEVDGN